MRKATVEFIGTFFLVGTIGCTGIAAGVGVIPPLAIGGHPDGDDLRGRTRLRARTTTRPCRSGSSCGGGSPRPIVMLLGRAAGWAVVSPRR